jgi:hypothetical protein
VLSELLAELLRYRAPGATLGGGGGSGGGGGALVAQLHDTGDIASLSPDSGSRHRNGSSLPRRGAGGRSGLLSGGSGGAYGL